jgi:hypothetical protein
MTSDYRFVKPIQIQLSPWMEFGEYLEGMELVSVSIGPSEDFYVLTVTKPAEYREQRDNWTSFAKINTSRMQDFRIVRLYDKGATSFEIERQNWNYHNIQPLPDEEFLLVCGRSRYRGPNDYDLNGKVFSQSGSLKREFLLGDGIQDVQTTTDGKIWVSYFDEGVFGNFGWGYQNNPPVGASGLILWDKFGKKLYEYSPPTGLDRICDCYALNVADNKETWFYYYTEFPLVRFRGDEDYTFWNIPVNAPKNWVIGGSGAFAIWDNLVLFRGGYQQSDKYQLVELLDNHEMRLQATYQFVNEQGKILKDGFLVARGRLLYLMEETNCYRVDLAKLL